jgi:hypothetical protein
MSNFEDIDVTTLTDDQLARHAHHLHTHHAAVARLLEKAKEELGHRSKRPGTRVVGDVSVVLSRPNRFSGQLAEKVLNKTQLRRISVVKPDATLAKEVFGEDSPLYKSLCEVAENWTVKIGKASTKQKVLDADGKLADPFVAGDEIVEGTD